MQSFCDIQPGDRVAVDGATGGLIEGFVERITPVHFVVDGKKYIKTTGEGASNTSRRFDRAYIITPDIEDRLRQTRRDTERIQLAEKLHKFPWGRLGPDALTVLYTNAERALMERNA